MISQSSKFFSSSPSLKMLLSFPKEKPIRRQWEVAIGRDNFIASGSSVLCSAHFKPEHLDRTGQTGRLRIGAIPSVFSFPAHHQKGGDHSYTLPSATPLKKKLDQALARVESLERENRNAKIRESRAKQMVRCLLDELKEKNLINKELQDRIDFYSGLNLDLLAKKSHEYSKDQREFALTLHLHGPKVYHYLRETLQLPLPHSKTWQKVAGVLAPISADCGREAGYTLNWSPIARHT
ncbi:THAP domain-containing protein 6-like [Phyllopteryx taeniolatus]|uniref:THAP domain-containing protein 6-like n=1 Tax=Phyllopteryx taeniolatus TaxID=161469 RepID=UPI002AD44F2C|nr:THAP domain-containing protein 6-like [Phyllopteryx taeniolatus]